MSTEPSNISLLGPGSDVLSLESVDGFWDYKAFYISAKANVNIKDIKITSCKECLDGGIHNKGVLTLTNSIISRNYTADYNIYYEGGGISNYGILTIESSVISENYSRACGGILNSKVLIIKNSAILKNEAPDEGGGLCSFSNSTLINSIVSENSSSLGAGISNFSTLIIENSNISNNYGYETIHSEGILTIKNSTILENSGIGILSLEILNLINSTVSKNLSGGILCGTTSTSIPTSCIIKDSTISENYSNYEGGGIYIDRGISSLINSTVSGNISNRYGGGIFNGGSTLTLVNSTVSENNSNNGSGIFNGSVYEQGSLVYGTLALKNTIIANNIGGDCYNDGGEISTITNTIIEDGSCEPPLSGDPNLGPLADNGGPTKTHALLAGSSAIDAGDDSSCPETDQRGILRPNVGCDIGAFELVENTGCHLYAVQDDGLNNSLFFKVNPETLAAEPLSNHPGYDIEALDTDPNTDTLYAASGDDTNNPGYLYTVNQAGALTDLGSTGFNEIEALTFHPDGTLWGWAKGDGLISITPQVSPIGTLVFPSDVEVESLTWNEEGTLLYAAQDTNLWVSDGTNDIQLACQLPGQTEALEMLPGNLLLIGMHGNKNILEFNIIDLSTCNIVVTNEMATPYNDIEGIAWPTKACSN